MTQLNAIAAGEAARQRTKGRRAMGKRIRERIHEFKTPDDVYGALTRAVHGFEPSDLIKGMTREGSAHMVAVVKKLDKDFGTYGPVPDTLAEIAKYSDNKTARMMALRVLARNAMKNEDFGLQEFSRDKIGEVRDQTEFDDVKRAAKKLVGVL